MKLSARNQIPARVTGITQGEAIANVVLDAGGVRLVASITVEAVRELGLKEGSEVTAWVKASDVRPGPPGLFSRRTASPVARLDRGRDRVTFPRGDMVGCRSDLAN